MLAAVGVYILVEKDEELGERVGKGLGARALAGFGLSVSIDELAIGFTIGLLRLAVALVVVLTAAQTLVASLAGSSLGA